MRPGEIYLAQFPFGDMPGMKLRPVLLLTGTLGSVPEILVYFFYRSGPPLPSDLILDPSQPEFKSTHLKTKSVLRLRKLATIHYSSLARSLGRLEAASLAAISTRLEQLLGLSKPPAR
jgi:hypothetical protein